jgi:hypothetical protein
MSVPRGSVWAMGLILSLIGGGLNVAAALWLVVAPLPSNLKDIGWGEGLPGVRKVVQQQRWVAAVVLVGSSLQFLGAVFAA